MSEAPAHSCDVDALLDEVLAFDMALLRHVNAQALAATDPDTLNGLVRSQQRLARSVRTTLTTKARLAEKRAARARAAGQTFPAYPWEERAAAVAAAAADDADDDEDPMNLLQVAAEARIRLEYDPDEIDEIWDRLPIMIFTSWERDGYEHLGPEGRLDKIMAHVRKTFGPSKTATRPDPTAPEPAPVPDATPGRLAPPMDLPSWDTS